MANTISRRMGDFFITWFEYSNSWVRFEEPAWFVVDQLNRGLGTETISRMCEEKYCIDYGQCTEFVNSIMEQIATLNARKERQTISFDPAFEAGSVPMLFSKRFYRIDDRIVCVEYRSRKAEYYLHPLLAHLKTNGPSGSEVARFSIYETDEGEIVLSRAGSPGSFIFKEYGRLKMRFMIELANLLHDKSTSDWMALVHAAAISDGKQTVLLTSGSGSGKSTLAAILVGRGFSLVSDDMVAIAPDPVLAYPFPAAISVKRPSVPVLKEYGVNRLASAISSDGSGDPPVWYLPADENHPGTLNPLPVRSIVFVRYDPAAGCKYRALDPADALTRFHEHAWLSDKAPYVLSFLNWFPEIPAYELTYGNTEKAIGRIERLFK